MLNSQAAVPVLQGVCAVQHAASNVYAEAEPLLEVNEPAAPERVRLSHLSRRCTSTLFDLLWEAIQGHIGVMLVSLSACQRD